MTTSSSCRRPWVAVNWRKPGDVKVNLPEVFKKLKIVSRPSAQNA